MFERILALVFLLSSLAFAQLDSSFVTVTSSKTASIQADQAIFAVYVDSDTNTTLNDIVAAVQSAGVTQTNFTGVTSQPIGLVQLPPPPTQPTLEWTFRLNVPLSATKDTVAKLTALQQSVQKATPLRLTFAIQGTQTSQQALQSQTCVLADLINDARAQAQKLADAASRTVAGILAMSSSVSNTVGNCSVTIKFGLLGS